jgi:hypothetical protein
MNGFGEEKVETYDVDWSGALLRMMMACIDQA